MKVSDIMVRNVQSCQPDANLESIAMLMWNSDCGSVPVVDPDGRTVGLITDRDISMASALSHKPLWGITSREVTSGRPVFTVHADDDVHSALKVMWAQKVRRLPVINGDGRLQGILSVDDVVACAERGSRGGGVPELSFDDAMQTLKAVCKHH
jgi:CBS domain-containing protein